MADERYAVGELADLGGVSRRTVRYYVQEGLIPAPLGVGRGDHYGREHLDRLLQVKALQEAGRSLDEIRQLLDGWRRCGGAAGRRRGPAAAARGLAARDAWRPASSCTSRTMCGCRRRRACRNLRHGAAFI